MFLTDEQVSASLQRLSWLNPFFGTSYLAFKTADLPVGEVTEVNFTQCADRMLEKYYKIGTHAGFFTPFYTSNKEKRWVSPRYSSTSLQRITTDTFAFAFIHEKKSQNWGWQNDYVRLLSEYNRGRKIPAFDLAVWLYREKDWREGIEPYEIAGYFFEEFDIQVNEVHELFDPSIPHLAKPWINSGKITEEELFDIIGSPPGKQSNQAASLLSLELQQVGPADYFLYEPKDRANIITGDNSLGKTFLLECIWWSLTGEWTDTPILPRHTASKVAPELAFTIASRRRGNARFSSRYNWDRQQWKNPGYREMPPGLVVYARSDGSFAVWDPARLYSSSLEGTSKSGKIFFSRNQIWEGLSGVDLTGRQMSVCNGLIRDWATWQEGKRYQEKFETLTACLDRLSPSSTVPLKPGPLIRLPGDARDIPTLTLPYGEVPIVYASAGIQRIIALAYALVWAWYEHLAQSDLIRRQPQKRLVILIDEVEAHLHPRWQRLIVPSILSVVKMLSNVVQPQLHIATHSPMVLASAETIFDDEIDSLYHLESEGGDVSLTQLPFVKRGRIDLWLMSTVFGLKQARSFEAEQAISRAKELQISKDPSVDDIVFVNQQLQRYLADIDEFWSRWTFFAEQHGVEFDTY